MESDLVGGKKGPLDGHAAEGSGANSSVWVATERATPVFELVGLTWCFLDEKFDRVLVRQKIASLYGVKGVRVKAIIFPCYSGHSAFSGHRVAAHGIHFRNDSHIELRIQFRGSNWHTEASRSSSHNYNIVTMMV